MSNVQSVKKVTIPKPKKVNPVIVYVNNTTGEQYTEAVGVVEDIEEENCQEYSDSEDINNIKFEISQSPYCCGFREVGELDCSSSTEPKFITEILDALVVNNKHTMFINTNGKGSSIDYEKALAKCKYWQKVKVFKNPGSTSTITLWISKN